MAAYIVKVRLHGQHTDREVYRDTTTIVQVNNENNNNMGLLMELLRRNKTQLFAILGILNTLLLIYLSVEEHLLQHQYHRLTSLHNQVKQHQQNSTPVDLCPIVKLLNSSSKEKYHLPYYEVDSKTSVKLSFCFGPKGPVIELRYVGGEMNGQGLDLNPYQFRLINKTEIEEHLRYIP